MKKLAIFFCLTLLAVGCRPSLPERQSAENASALRAFYVGLGALQVGDDVRAKEKLTEAARLADGEPAAWTNLGVLQLRHKEFEDAVRSFDKADQLAPQNAAILTNIAVLETQRGNFDTAISTWQKVVEIESANLKARYSIVREYERRGDDAQAARQLSALREQAPNNLALALDSARLAAKSGDAKAFESLLSDVSRNIDKWPEEARMQFDKAYKSTGDLRQGAIEISYLRNVLLREPSFRAALSEIQPSDTEIGQPILKPLKLVAPDFRPAEPDLGLKFTAQPVAEVKARFAKAVFLNGDDAPVVAWSDEKELRVGSASLPFAVENANGLTALDFDYDFKNDIAIAGETGFRLFKQTANGSFADVTAQTKLSNAILQRSYVGVWPFDVESDGDLDLVLAAKGAPVVLQNNSDGSFKELNSFPTLSGVKDFEWFDIDEDGDGDAIALDDAGRLSFYRNERGGLFESRGDETISDVIAIAVGDPTNSGRLMLFAIKRNGSPIAISDDDGSIAQVQTFAISQQLSDGRLLTGDLDNNGALDTVSTESVMLTGAGKSSVVVIDGNIFDVVDMNSEGRLDLVGLDSAGRPSTFVNSGTKNYHWQVLRPRAQEVVGDQRVNSFGIGGEVEVRAGLQLQKRVITSPQVHFGLGEQTSTDVMRVVWGNGLVQAEFELVADQKVEAVQRLKGSCPHLFAWDGRQFRMVKDAPPWSPALGLKINAQDTFGIIETEEWFKIPGEMLRPKDGFYELRITAEYWETFYIDHYSLMVVDHPDRTEVFTDERFSVPPTPLKVFTTEPRREFAFVKNDKGEDVAGVVRYSDEKYLDGIERGTFQGIAKDHFVEIELPTDAPRDKKLWLIADGWVHPTDASINVQSGQSSKEPPRSLSLEAQQGDGTWKIVKNNLGFPAGKMKTVMIELVADARRFRLRTNMEIFWDRLAWGIDIDSGHNLETRLPLSSAELRYRGFSVIDKRDDSSPEVPQYDKLLTTGQRWRALEGYYTRYGDVIELLSGIDDRFVLAGAGDEIVLRFGALPEPKVGWRRDFVIIGDGWIKDGDLNSVYSKTVLPLPTHASNDYSRRPALLEDDPVYKKNKTDWVNFHTRYVAPDRFRNALRIK